MSSMSNMSSLLYMPSLLYFHRSYLQNWIFECDFEEGGKMCKAGACGRAQHRQFGEEDVQAALRGRDSKELTVIGPRARLDCPFVFQVDDGGELANVRHVVNFDAKEGEEEEKKEKEKQEKEEKEDEEEEKEKG